MHESIITSNEHPLEKARALIHSARKKNLTLDKRMAMAIELAALILKDADLRETVGEKERQAELARMMDDPLGRVFIMRLTDQCFRTKNSWRVADQILFLLHQFGVPEFLSPIKKFQIRIFESMGKVLAPLMVPFIKRFLHKECSKFILPGEKGKLFKEISKRQKNHLRINLNHLGEAILGEQEAHYRLKIYMEDLRRPEVEYISVKVSTIYSQLHLIAWEDTLSILEVRLKQLLGVAYENKFKRADGTLSPKFVNLDMEEYRDLALTVELFKRVLDDPEFLHHSVGIVLQSYLPDSFQVQQELTEWSIKRIARGGAPIKIRIVKGANLAMEKVEAALHGWPQAPYSTKAEVDANFKRMLSYALQKDRAQAVHIGIGSHNLFDLAYGFLLSAENDVEDEVSFEMLEGMADSQRHVVQNLAKDMLLYCPAANKSEFQNAVAYLIRRLDENTSPDNFLRQIFKLKEGSVEWQKQAQMFMKSCEESEFISSQPRRTQDRMLFKEENLSTGDTFENVQDTDWSLASNRLWAQKISEEWSQKPKESIPLVIGGETLNSKSQIDGFNPSDPKKVLYSYSVAGQDEIEKTVKSALEAHEQWQKKTVQERIEILGKAAALFSKHRADLMGVMIADTGKILMESDAEISEAIDFIEYYRRNLKEISSWQDITWRSKGPILVTPPWNFPCSIPVGGIAAALAAGNSVIFKPAPEAVWVGWIVVQLFWQAGIERHVLQFINCEDEPYGSKLIQDPRLAAILLTGGTETAQHFMKLRPELNLIAETGGKNAMIISNMADRDQAVKDLVQSAFGHAGQKCSACSLAICHAEVYDDPQFRRQLRDAAASWNVGSAWQPETRLNPLIRPPGAILKRGLTELEDGEEWLLEPKQDPSNPCLWSPGIKLGVKSGSFTRQTELFGPVLGLMRADSLFQAIQMANQSHYGLTAGLHSLDLREQQYWSDTIEAGNCYINRTITGAIVQRQPFGGWKESGYSPGAKAGGPNYLMQLMQPLQVKLPEEREDLHENIEELSSLLASFSLRKQELWRASVENYLFHWTHYFSQGHDPSHVLGEDNFLRYVPHKNLNIRFSRVDDPIDILRIAAAAKICGSGFNISVSEPPPFRTNYLFVESDEVFLNRLKAQGIKRLRFLSEPSSSIRRTLADMGCYAIIAPVMANGRLELLRYFNEQSLTIAYHRYGNLGEREFDNPNEPRP